MLTTTAFFLRFYWHEHCGVNHQCFLTAGFCPEGCSHYISPLPFAAARLLDFLSNHFLTTPATVCCCSDISLLRYPPMWCENFNQRANNENLPHTAQLFVYKSENSRSKQSGLVLAHLFRTVSSSLHLLQRRLPQSLVGQLQLVSEPAQVPLCFGLDDTQLCVDVLVLICCIFFVLKTQCLAVEIKGADAIPGEFRLKGVLGVLF